MENDQASWNVILSLRGSKTLFDFDMGVIKCVSWRFKIIKLGVPNLASKR